MSAPEPPAPAASGRWLARRALVVVAITAGGFALVVGAFAALGYGTDLHARRVWIALAPLLATGVVVARVGRVHTGAALVALLGLAGAGAVWWHAPDSDSKSAMRLRDAVALRDKVRAGLAAPADGAPLETYGTAAEYRWLHEHYPSLAQPMRGDFNRWTETGVAAIHKRYLDTPPDDLKGALGLRLYRIVPDVDAPARFFTLNEDEREWFARALKARTEELEKLTAGDWAGFDRTAPARKSLASSDTASRDALIAAEEKWADVSATELLKVQARLKTVNDQRAVPVNWTAAAKSLMALQSLDSTDGRFKSARQKLFNGARAAVETEIAEYHKTKHFHRAHGIARKHAVDWNATATLLGPDEVAKLDALRKKCAALANPDVPDPDPDGDPDIAPPPRPKQ
jgi:hypothetical protein